MKVDYTNYTSVWHRVSDDRIRDNDFMVIIEIAKGSKKKYELDKDTGLLILDRVLHTSVQYPSNYGFIPKTVSSDGDPLDVLVLSSESLQPMSMVRCYPIGVVTMNDNGKDDEKIIAIPFKDPYYNTYKCVSKLPKHIGQEIVHFLKVYKDLEKGETSVGDIESAGEARKVIRKTKLTYIKQFGNM